ncbi:MAG: TonB-dependent receptor plug domain-containing protein, partial [Gammaproteobacteria bacterium]|nr:TonB-dependent receptor plug domain-containing protein [Gammaproteobacteria bacterium]
MQNELEPGIAQRRFRECRAPQHGNTFLKRQIATANSVSAASARSPDGPAHRRPPSSRGRIHGLLAVFSLLPGVLTAQTGGVEGRVVDSDGPPVFAANILLALPDAPDQVDRIAESDRFGYYRIESLPPGRYLLRVQRIGYGEIERPVEIVADRRIEVDVTLTATPVVLEGVSVSTAETRERSRFLETAGVTVREISQAELRLVPGLAEADPIRAVEVLPGVVSTSDFTASFNVRGGSADQNLILLDGVPIFNPFHLGGIFSVFNADMVGRVELSSGGFPAEHGGRVSSLLLVESDPGTDDFNVRGGVSLLAARAALGGRAPAVVEETLGLQRLKWRASGRRSWFDQLPRSVPYHLTDFQGVVEGWTPGGSRILITAYTGNDVFNLTEVDEDDEDGFPLRAAWEWGNDLIGMRWTMPRRDGGALDVRAGYTRFNSALAFPDFSDTEFSSGISQLSLGGELEHALGRRWTLKSGVSADRMTHLNLVRAGGTQFTDNSGEGWLGGVFAHAEWRGGLSWLVEAGLRADR